MLLQNLYKHKWPDVQFGFEHFKMMQLSVPFGRKGAERGVLICPAESPSV